MSDTPNALPPAAAVTARGRMKMALAWSVGLGLLAWLVHKLPWASAWAAMQRPSALTWLGVIATLLVSYGLRGARLQVVMGLNDSDTRGRTVLGLRLDALRVILMHNAAVNLLPMRAGELSFPWLAATELRMPLPRAMACLVWMRVQDLVVLAWLGLMVWPGLPVWLRGLGLLALIAGGGLLTWLSHQAQHGAKAGPATGRWWVKWRHALAEPAHHRPLAWILTVSNWVIKLAAGATLLAAITGSAWLTAWGGALGGELAAVVPLQGPAGFGTYEAGVWAAMSWLSDAHDPARDHAITAALSLHACFLICACLAGFTAWCLRPRGHTASTSNQTAPLSF